MVSGWKYSQMDGSSVQITCLILDGTTSNYLFTVVLTEVSWHTNRNMMLMEKILIKQFKLLFYIL